MVAGAGISGSALIPDTRDVPEVCEQGECEAGVTTWCPLCDKFLCAEHDELGARRMHDCLAGPADA